MDTISFNVDVIVAIKCVTNISGHNVAISPLYIFFTHTHNLLTVNNVLNLLSCIRGMQLHI